MRGWRLFCAFALAVFVCALAVPRASGQLRSFGDAEGFGSVATGARNASAPTIYHVTNLNDTGAGSFRDAVSGSNRIVVFDVGGYVHLTTPVSAQSNLTILGQTAPGDGIGIYGAEVSFFGRTNDIVRYVRFRDTTLDPGYNPNGTSSSSSNAINIGSTSNMIFDHVSAEFAAYNNVDAAGAANLTFQNSLVAAPIASQRFNFHWEGGDGAGTFVNNVFGDGHNRSILAKGDLQYINNTVYNYQAGLTSGNSAGVFRYDVIGNYFITGPSTTSASNDYYQIDSNQSAYATGNVRDSNNDGTLGGSASNTVDGAVVLAAPWSPSTAQLPQLSANASYNWNVVHAGDSLKHDPTTFVTSLGYDQVDAYLMGTVQTLGTAGRLWGSETQTGLANGGLGTINTGSKPTDTDNDGIPDAWEATHGMNPNSAADALLFNPLGYRMIEQYANELAQLNGSRSWSAASGTWTTNTNWTGSIAPSQLEYALIRGTGAANGAVTVSSGTATAMTVSIGGNGPAAGEKVTVSGGTLNVYDTMTVGDQNNGSLVISGGTVQAYNIILGNTITGASPASYTGSITLSSGTLAVSQIALRGGSPSNWTSGGSVTWTGGTIKGIAQLNIKAPLAISGTGGMIDSGGFDGVVSGAISGSAGITKIGGGVLTLSGTNTYAGGTTISAGELGISSDANIGGAATAITFNGGLLQVNGTALTNLNSHTVNWSSFNGGFDIATSGNTFNVSQAISGSGSFTKAGGGTLVLSGSNSYTGGTTISAGVLTVAADNNLGAVGSPINFAGGTLRITGTTFTNLSNHAPTFSAAVSTIDVNTAANVFTISQTIGGSGGITKAGPGVLVLSGTNSFTGDTNISAGTLRIGNALALRKSTVNLTTAGAVLDLNGFNATLGGLAGTQGLDLKGTTLFVGANTETYSGVISSSTGAGAVVKNGSGTWTVSGASIYTGSTTLSAGILNVSTLAIGGTASPIGQSTNAAANLVFDGGTLQYTGSVGLSSDRLFTLTANGGTIDGSGTSGDGVGLTNTGAIAFTGTGNRTLNLIGTETHNAFFPALGDPTGGKTSLTVNGTGRWLWESKLSTYSGDTTILAGTLRLFSGGFLPSGAGKGNVVVDAGGILVADASTGINALNDGSSGPGSVTVSAGTLTVGNGDATGSFSGAISGAGGIAKTGAGTQTLSGTNTYTGATTVSGGVLRFNSAGSIGGTGASVTISAGAVAGIGYAIDQTTLARFTGATAGTVALAANTTNNLNLGSTGANLPSADLGAIGAVTDSGTITPVGAGYFFGGGGGTLTLSSASALAGNVSVTVGLGNVAPASLAGTLTLNVSVGQTYTGPTTIKAGGTLTGPIANGLAASAVGASSNISANLVLDGGTLGTIGTTDRLFTLTPNGGTLDNSGGLSITNTGSLAFAAAGISPTLTLAGTSTAHNTLSPAIADPAGGKLSILKTGAGKWTFTGGAKAYSGDTHVAAGTLEVLASGALSPNSNLVLDAGASLDLHDQATETIGALSGAGAVVNSFSGSHTDTLAIGANNGGANFTGTITSSGVFNLLKSGTGTQTLSGANSFAGTTTISGGTLQLGANNTLPVGSNIALAGGNLAAAGFSDNFGTGTLGLSSSSQLDFGTGASVLKFGSSITLAWTGTLTITGWSGSPSGGGADQIFVGTSAAGLTASQLANIVFAGSGMLNSALLPNGEVVPGRTLVPGDFNGDTMVTTADISAMFEALTNKQQFETEHSLSDTDLVTIGDFDGDHLLTNADVQGLLFRIAATPANGSPAAVPEPAAIGLAVVGLAGLIWLRGRLAKCATGTRSLPVGSATKQRAI